MLIINADIVSVYHTVNWSQEAFLYLYYYRDILQPENKNRQISANFPGKDWDISAILP